MPWFRVDDQFWSHPKISRLPAVSVALWVRAGSWSMQYLTDGFIPTHALAMLGATKGSIRSLVDADLWAQVDGGWQFHDWHSYQETAEVLKKERDAAKARMKKYRDSQRAAKNGERSGERSGERAPEATGDVQTLHIHPHPSPTGDDISIRPELNREGSGMDDEESLEEVNARLAERVYGVDWTKVRNKVGVLVGGIPNPSFVIALIAEVHDRAHKPIKSPTGVVLKSLDNDWADWQKRYFEQEGAA